MGKDYCIDVLNPEDPSGPRVAAIIPYRYYSKINKFYPVQFENLKAAKAVLEAPERIFSGARALNEGGWCFTGRPAVWSVVNERIQVPFPSHLVFAVYLNDRFTIYECRAEVAADDDALCPIDWQHRYSALVWKRTS